jgi:serine protease Do
MKQFSKFVSGFVIGVVSVAIWAGAWHSNLWAKGSLPSIAVDNSPISRSTSGLTSFAPVVKRAAPSVVNIYSTRNVHYHANNPFMNDPFFRQFFGNPNGDQHQMTHREEVLGSGIIISPDGYILTANHVIANAEQIKIAITGNKIEYTAKVIGSDPDTDVAVLKIDANNLSAITLGDSSQLEVGDIVLAIGNPFDISQPGQTPTVTMGIVSALGRSGLGFNGYENFIQTDAAINPGNSGGALVDAEGRLVGINTGIESSSEGSEGIGFAVPINLAHHVAEHLISGGKVTRGYLGVHPEDISPGLAYNFSLNTENGALVGFVEPGTPAEKAGIKSGDVIDAYDGQPIKDANDLMLAVADCSPDSKATLKILRDGKERTVTVVLAERPGEVAQTAPPQNETDALDGVTVEDLDSDLRSQLQVPDEVQGAIVTEVVQDSHAGEAGLQKADIIVAVDHHSVSDSDQVVKLCNAAKGKYILLKIWRKDGDVAGTSYVSVDNTKE